MNFLEHIWDFIRLSMQMMGSPVQNLTDLDAALHEIGNKYSWTILNDLLVGGSFQVVIRASDRCIR